VATAADGPEAGGEAPSSGPAGSPQAGIEEARAGEEGVAQYMSDISPDSRQT
jgi:hypothetical protein